MRPSHGWLLRLLFASLLVLAAVAAMPPHGHADIHQVLPSCGDRAHLSVAGLGHHHAGDAGDMHRNCCSGTQCTAGVGGVLPSAVPIPGGGLLGAGHWGCVETLSGIDPAPGGHPPRPRA